MLNFIVAVVSGIIGSLLVLRWQRRNHPLIVLGRAMTDQHLARLAQPNKETNHEMIGYINAKNWHPPFTNEQRAILIEKYPDQKDRI